MTGADTLQLFQNMAAVASHMQDRPGKEIVSVSPENGLQRDYYRCSEEYAEAVRDVLTGLNPPESLAGIEPIFVFGAVCQMTSNDLKPDLSLGWLARFILDLLDQAIINEQNRDDHNITLKAAEIVFDELGIERPDDYIKYLSEHPELIEKVIKVAAPMRQR